MTGVKTGGRNSLNHLGQESKEWLRETDNSERNSVRVGEPLVSWLGPLREIMCPLMV